ncbi:hypothetical protein WCLP8_5220008 [uncultured Gammaproteobacteria bacterium]
MATIPSFFSLPGGHLNRESPEFHPKIKGALGGKPSATGVSLAFDSLDSLHLGRSQWYEFSVKRGSARGQYGLRR